MVAFNTCATYSNREVMHKWIDIPVYMVLIDHPKGKILFDTDCPENAMTGKWPKNLCELFPYNHKPENTIEAQLNKIGFTIDDIDIVVQSHLHLDHAGNLGKFEGRDVYVHEEDLKYGLYLTHQNPDPSTHGPYIREDLEAKVNFIPVDRDMKFVDNIEFISLPGHTPGVLGMVVHLKKDGTFIFPSDAIYQSGNFGVPPKQSGIVYNNITFIESIEKVRDLQRKYNGKVFFSHDLDFFNTVKLAPSYYE